MSMLTSLFNTRSQERRSLFSQIMQILTVNYALTFVGVIMLVALVGTLIGIIIDQRVITGAPAWVKPTKFVISTAVYSFTFLWFLSFIRGFRRLVSVVANVTAAALFLEVVLIISQVIRGTASHFNSSTFLDNMIFAAMGMMIIALWIMALVAAILLLVQRQKNPALTWSLRFGLLVTLVGMAGAFLMIYDVQALLGIAPVAGVGDISGAHSVGVVDGGPGLPFLGWSTTGGDLRVAHFFGLHGLQALPLIGWLLTRFASHVLPTAHRVALVWTAGFGYLGLVILFIWQALRAQSVIAPDMLTLQTFALLFGGTVLAVIAIVTHARLRNPQTTS